MRPGERTLGCLWSPGMSGMQCSLGILLRQQNSTVTQVLRNPQCHGQAMSPASSVPHPHPQSGMCPRKCYHVGKFRFLPPLLVVPRGRVFDIPSSPSAPQREWMAGLPLGDHDNYIKNSICTNCSTRCLTSLFDKFSVLFTYNSHRLLQRGP